MSAIDVFIGDGTNPGDTTQVGTAFTRIRRSQVTTTFTYDTGYLANTRAFDVSPDLPLVERGGSVAGLPGAFADCSPDRWGRNLILKRLLADHPSESGPARAVTDVDFLLGVSDATRQGALRFAIGDHPEFQAPGVDVPKLIELPALLRAAERVAGAAGGADEFEAVKALLDAGTGSLGGARPKASVRDGERLMIAKFPHPHDDWDVMAWETVALDLVVDAGVQVPEHDLIEIDGRNVVLLERFDRREGVRVPYVSAMSLLRGGDGEHRDYLEIAEAIVDSGAAVDSDLAELFRRIAFSIAVHNTDDHLRNHGFLHVASGWQLSPAFDINPNPIAGAQRMTSIAYADGTSEGQALLRSCDHFGLDEAAALPIVADVSQAVSSWRDVARRHGITAAEQHRFAAILEAKVW